MAKNEDPQSNTKQFGDACEHYVLAMLGFANVPAVKMPDNWPGYDVVAQLHPGQLQQIAVQGRRLPNSGMAFRLKSGAVWDWFAAVPHCAKNSSTRCWILPRRTALLLSTKMPVASEHRLNISVLQEHPEWESNFKLKRH